MSHTAVMLLLFLALAAAVALLFSMHRRGVRHVLLNVVFGLVVLGFLLLAAEAGFEKFYAASDGWGFTLAARQFQKKYWGPVNSLGMRDDEHTPASFKGKKVVYILGDSIAEGHGVRDRELRYGNIIRRRLGPGWKVVYVAKGGWSTLHQLKALGACPYPPPDVIVLGYSLNDFESAARWARGAGAVPGWVRHSPKTELDKKFYAPLVNGSHLANFVYWRLYRRGAFNIGNKYLGYLNSSYSDPKTWAAHTSELYEVAEYAREENAALIAAVFPLFGDAAGSRPLTKKAAQFFTSQGVDTVDFGPVFSKYPAKKLVAGPADGHPSPFAHGIIAERLMPEIRNASTR